MHRAHPFRQSGVCRFAALASLFVAVGCQSRHPAVVGTPPPAVEVSQPIERTITDYQVFTARTQAVESVEIKARVTGYLTKIEFKDGDDVQQGDVLFQIDDRSYGALLDQAKAALELAKAALIKTQADYEIGLSVQKQDQGAISKQDLIRRLGARDEAKANVDVNTAALESAQLNYDWCKVTAPISGRANTHFVDVGNLVSQDVTTLTNIVSLKPTWAYFDVDENTMLRLSKLVAEGKIKNARTSTVPVQMGLADDTGFPYAGTIDFVSNQLDPNTGSIRARAAFPNEDGALAAGLFGRLRVPIGAPHDALLITDQAVGTDQSQKFILVLNDQDEVEYRAVEVRQVHDGMREVMRYRTITVPGASGGPDTTKQVEVLKPTDRVIVNGLQRVRPGVKVSPRNVDMLTLMNTGADAAGKPPANAKSPDAEQPAADKAKSAAE